MDRFFGFMSTNTGLNPDIMTELISDTQVNVGTITSFFLDEILFNDYIYWST